MSRGGVLPFCQGQKARERLYFIDFDFLFCSSVYSFFFLFVVTEKETDTVITSLWMNGRFACHEWPFLSLLASISLLLPLLRFQFFFLNSLIILS